MEVQRISNLSKDELINIFKDNGFTYDESSDKFTKTEEVNTGKLIVNGKEICKTQKVTINVEYIYTGAIEDPDKSLVAHQMKLIINENELEFLITDKYDLHDFFGLDVGDISDRITNKSKTKIIEDLL